MLKKLKERELARGGITGTNVSLDICIVMDTTGSMDSFLDEAKKAAESLIGLVKSALQDPSALENTTVRFSFIAYRDRDLNDPSLERGHMQICNFTTDSHVAVSKLATINAYGGGDVAEDVGDALEKAVSLKWESEFRILVHFLDAPPHGSAHHDLDEPFGKSAGALGPHRPGWDPFVNARARDLDTRARRVQPL
jgi:hypothetical protein